MTTDITVKKDTVVVKEGNKITKIIKTIDSDDLVETLSELIPEGYYPSSVPHLKVDKDTGNYVFDIEISKNTASVFAVDFKFKQSNPT